MQVLSQKGTVWKAVNPYIVYRDSGLPRNNPCLLSAGIETMETKPV